MPRLKRPLSMEQCNGEPWSPTQSHPKKRRSTSLVPETCTAPVAISKSARSKRGQWTEDTMRLAIDAIHCGEKSIRSAAKLFSIPASSIHNWLHGKTRSKKLGHGTYLTETEEHALKSWCFKMQEVAFSVTLAMLKNTVSDIIRACPRPNPFKDDIPGQRWWARFKRRHPDVVLRCGDALTMKRAVALRSISCDDFFHILKSVIDSHGYTAERIWNVDETGLQARGHNASLKVVARKGSKRVPITTADNREWLSIAVCVNAAGSYIPHYYVFKGTYVIHDYIRDCEPRAAMNVQKNGWMTKDLFYDWVSHFCKNVPGGVSVANRHLLILDGHCSHVSAAVIHLCSSKGIDIVTIPSHTSHRLQPLDVSCFRPFKLYFDEEKRQMVLKNPNWSNGHMHRSTLATMASQALLKALTPSNIKAGFRASGLFPVNANKMKKHFGPNEPYKEVETCPQKVKKDSLSQHPQETVQQSEDTNLREIDLNIEPANDTMAYIAKRASSKDAEVSNINTDEGSPEAVQGIWAIHSTLNSAVGVSDSIEIPSGQDTFWDSRLSTEEKPPIHGNEDIHIISDDDYGNDFNGHIVDAFLAWPPDDADRVVLCESDLECLQPRQWLLDSIVDLYLKYLVRKYRTQFNIGLFSSFLYRRLKSVQDRRRQYDKLHKRMEHVNIFECDYVFIPVVDSGHWSLIFLCGIGERSSEKVVPSILHLNSLSGYHGDVGHRIQFFIEEECKLRNFKSQSIFPTIQNAEVSQQQNTSDCGLYVLIYADLLLEHIQHCRAFGKREEFSFLSRKVVSVFDADRKRVAILDLISELRSEQMSQSGERDSLQPLQEAEYVEGLENIPPYLSNILCVPKFPPYSKDNNDLNEREPLQEKREMNLGKRKISSRLNPHGCHITSIEYVAKLDERMREDDENKKQALARRRMKEEVLMKKKEEKSGKRTEQTVAAARQKRKASTRREVKD